MKKLAMIAFVALSLTGCASVLKGSNETINVNSVEKGTTIYVDGAARGLDNASVSLKKVKPTTSGQKKRAVKPLTQQLASPSTPPRCWVS